MDWIQIGTALPGKKINALHIANNTIFVNVYEQGIFASNDKGMTWQCLNYNLENLKVRAIIKTRGQLFAGTDNGIFKFIGGLNVWQSESERVQINSFSLYNGAMIAGTSKGVLLSDQRIETWHWIHNEGAVQNTEVLNGQMFIMQMSGELYASQHKDRLYKVDYASDKTSSIYDIVLFEDHLIMSNNGGIYESTDNGKSWSLVHQTKGYVFYDLIIMDNMLIGGTKGWINKDNC